MKTWRRGIVLLMLAGLCVATGSTGCGTTRQIKKKAESQAEAQFLIAQQKFRNGDYKGAIEKYDRVRNDYPYSPYAVQADLRIADAYFKQDQYASAIEQYEAFVKLHPRHDKVPYARFRAAKAAYENMPGSPFLMPPAYERDLTKTHKATRKLKTFLDKHGDSTYTDKAETMLRKARRRLADHELYVAEFHLDRNNPRAASMRLKYLLNTYSGLGLDPKALFLLAKSYLKMGESQKARTAFQELVRHHGDSKFAKRAKRHLDRHSGSSSKKTSDNG
ncbi:MAG: outer membrane protein assembly factor BamD [Bradymonadaceae bacterium]